MREVIVNTGVASYPICIGHGLLRQSGLLRCYLAGQQALIVSNDTVAPLYLGLLQAELAGIKLDSLILPDGESYKSLEEWQKILDLLIRQRHHRDTTVIALGGGVVGDTAGFAAACFHRGVAFIQIPTTLLAQVDASIGGKTAVNHPLGKNLIGAFHQPRLVLIDTAVLSTLPVRHFCAGLAEVIKAALIRKADFFTYLENNLTKLLAFDPETLIATISEACKIKADIVSLDEKEQNLRALCNLGHTFGHAIEQNLEYRDWLHGEAVAMGMLLAAELSVQKSWLTRSEQQRIFSLIQRAKLPTQLPAQLSVDHILLAMQADKKILNNQMRFILLSRLGEGIITTDVSKDMLCDVLLKFGAKK